APTWRQRAFAGQARPAAPFAPLTSIRNRYLLCTAKLRAGRPMNLDKALADITAIRSQMARGAEFRGYGPATVAATGCVALLAAVAQALFLPDPSGNVLAYLALWIATAAISVALIGIEMGSRSRRMHSGLADEMIWAATGQFIP